MKLRFLALITLLFASNAGASVLSASSQAVREPSSASPAMRDATTAQHDLNVSLRDAATDVHTGSLATLSRPSAGSGGLIISGTSSLTGRTSSSTFQPFSNSSAYDGLFDPNDGSVGRMYWDPAAGKHGSGTSGGGVGGGFGRRDRGNPIATPEPSTWLLIAVGLLLVGTYNRFRNRFSAETR
jgi:hypothetical protein